MRVSHKKFFLILGGIIILAYGLWQARDFIQGPRIYLESPKEGEIFETGLISLKGEAVDVSRLVLNGRTIVIDEEGNFEEKILLLEGVNIIELYAADKFGHEARMLRTVLLKETTPL